MTCGRAELGLSLGEPFRRHHADHLAHRGTDDSRKTHFASGLLTSCSHTPVASNALAPVRGAPSVLMDRLELAQRG